ncbi:MAG: 50S ribosomal protein L17 [Bacteroidetes bacterium]|nr:MAG: 50S ribosomal protein L17 [Bacteroidota bacterium]
MRHGKKVNHLGRKAAHRKAMLANMAVSLIEHKRITTTVAKAKALRVYIEPLVTKAKNDTMHSRRTVFSYLKNKEAIKELFGPIAEAVATRPGGYTRILKIGNRKGDNAEMAFIEFVDFNEFAPGKSGSSSSSSRRRRRRKSRSSDAKEVETPVVEDEVEVVEETVEAVKEAEVVEEVVEEVAEAAEEVVEEATEEVAEETATEEETDEEKKEGDA